MTVQQLPLFVPSSDWVAPELPTLPRRGRLSIDVETRDETLSELGPGVRRGAYIVGIAVGVEDGRRWYFPTRHEGGGNLDEALVRRWAREELNAFEGEVVGAKLDYDLDFLAEIGVTFPLAKVYHDVQVIEPLLDEWRYEYNLNALSNDYLGVGKSDKLLKEAGGAYGWRDAKTLKSNLWKLPASLVGPYAEGDVDLPLRILPHQLARLREEGLETVYAVEKSLIPLLVRMRRRGVRVDVEKARRVREALVKRRSEAVAKLKRLAGPKAELTLPDTLAQGLRDRGIAVPLTEKTRKPSVTKGLLAQHAGDELVATILEGRKLNTIIGTFLDSHIFTHAIKGRIHCTFNQLKGDDGGTIARFSSENPNLQNIPARDEEIGPLIRSIFVPDEGENWRREDWSQIEYRFLAHYAIGRGAEEARRQYREEPKTDFHKMCAGMMGANPEDKVKRKQVKNVNFGKVYGGGIAKLALTMECSYEEAETFSREYDRLLPFVRETADAASRWANRRGYVVSVLERRQRFLLWEPVGNHKRPKDQQAPPLLREKALAAYGPRIRRYMTHAALNRKLQSSAADLMKKAMVDADRDGLFGTGALGAPLITCHDELGLSVPQTNYGREVAETVARIMETTIPLRVPIIVSSSEGKNWGEAG